MLHTARSKLVLLVVLALVMLASVAGLVAFATNRQAGTATPQETTLEVSSGLSAELRAAVEPDGILEHTDRFAAIAAANGGNRAAGTPGYAASAAYVARTLRQSGYEVEVQRFRLPPSAGDGHATSNVIATSPGGDESSTVMVGAHLDSVPYGPGINDNGSGTATVLEIAQELAKLEAEPRNRVRFAFWGGEELGLLGSKHYVSELDETEVADIAVYLNFDMVGSPNYVPFVYGSPEVKRALEEFFDVRDLETAEVDLAGRSDHGPFAAAGVPAGGIFSGDSTPKTRDEAEAFGGEAGVPYDSCYHRACDDRGNLSREALDRISDAATHATATFAGRRGLSGG